MGKITAAVLLIAGLVIMTVRDAWDVWPGPHWVATAISGTCLALAVITLAGLVQLPVRAERTGGHAQHRA